MLCPDGTKGRILACLVISEDFKVLSPSIWATSLNILPGIYLLILLLGSFGLSPILSLFIAMESFIFFIGFDIRLKLLLGAYFFRLDSVGNSILTLILSARDPACKSNSSEEPGMALTCTYPLNMYSFLNRLRVSQILSIVKFGLLIIPELKNKPSI